MSKNILNKLSEYAEEPDFTKPVVRKMKLQQRRTHKALKKGNVPLRELFPADETN